MNQVAMINYDQIANLISQNYDVRTISILTDTSPDEVELIATNMELESKMQAIGAERFKVRQDALRSQGKVFETDVVMIKIKQMLKPFAKAIADFRDNYKSKKPHVAVEVFKRHDEYQLALMTMRACISAETTDKRELASLCFRLCEHIEPELETQKAFRVGCKLIKLMCDQSNAHFEIVTKRDGTTSIHMIQATEAFYEWEDSQENELAEVATILRPTAVPPRPWTALDRGGYYDKGLQAKFIRNAPKVTERTHGPHVIPEVYRAVNLIQATPFTVNNFVLDTANELMFDDELFFEKWIQKVPERPHNEQTKNLRATIESCNDRLGITQENREKHGKGFGQWVRDMLTKITSSCDRYQTKRELEDARYKMVQYVNWRKDLTSIKSKNRVINTALDVANEYASLERIYFPANLDWRMRVYPMCSGLTTQGVCLQKALIKFAEGKPLTASKDPERALEWLKVHTANCFGMDKKSWNDRIEWTDANRELIQEIHRDPVDNVDLWKGTDDPWLFLAACEQMCKVYDHGLSAVIDIPIPMDGTCNGAQHYAAMTHDRQGAYGVNVAPNGTQGMRERLSELRTKLSL